MLKLPFLVFVGVVVIGLVIIFGLFHVREVDVIGNEFYSSEEIQRMVMSDSLGENSIYLTWKYSQPDAAQSLPFLSGVEVSMVNPYHVQIKVYEKSIVGYLMYSGSMVYFDKDGYVVEISDELRDGVPPFSGVPIGQPVITEPLPVADEVFFRDIIEAADMIAQSGLEPLEVHYDDKQQLILYFTYNRVIMGDNSYLEEKLSNLRALFSEMEELEGTLHMENFTAGSNTIPFKVGEKGEEELIITINPPEEIVEEQNVDESAEIPEDGEAWGDSGYVEKAERFSTDASGQQFYTDEAGNVTYNLDMPYLGEDGNVISDGYGHIDPYTGAYILNQ